MMYSAGRRISVFARPLISVEGISEDGPFDRGPKVDMRKKVCSEVQIGCDV